MGGGKKPQVPEVPAPEPIPKPPQEVTNAFTQARSKSRKRVASRGLAGTDITGGLLNSTFMSAKKTLLGG